MSRSRPGRWLDHLCGAMAARLSTRSKTLLVLASLRLLGRVLTGSRLDRLARTLAHVAIVKRGALAAEATGNLRVILGSAATAAELRAATLTSLQSYFAHWLEFARMAAFGEAATTGAVRLVGLDRVREIQATGRGVVVLAFHMGRYEISAAAASQAVGGITGVARPLGSEVAREVLTQVRSAAGNDDVCFVDPATGGGRVRAAGQLIQRLRRGGALAVMIDRYAVGPTTLVPFFGRRLALASGPVAMAMRTDAALLPSFTWQEDGITVGLIGEEVPIADGTDDAERHDATLEQIARLYEDHISRHPHEWHLDIPLFR